MMHSIVLGQEALEYLSFALAEDFVLGDKDALFDNIKLRLNALDLLCVGVNQKQVLRVGLANSLCNKWLETHKDEGFVGHQLNFVRFDLHAIKIQIRRKQ